MVTMGIALAPLAESMPQFALLLVLTLLPMQLVSGPGELVRFISGRIEEMGPKAIRALDTLGRVLGLPPLALPAPTKDPLKTSTAAAPDDLSQLATAGAAAVEEPMSRAAFEAVLPKGKAKTMEPT